MTGCTKISAGCDHCYAELIAWRKTKTLYLAHPPVRDTPTHRDNPFAPRFWANRLTADSRRGKVHLRGASLGSARCPGSLGCGLGHWGRRKWCRRAAVRSRVGARSSGNESALRGRILLEAVGRSDPQCPGAAPRWRPVRGIPTRVGRAARDTGTASGGAGIAVSGDRPGARYGVGRVLSLPRAKSMMCWTWGWSTPMRSCIVTGCRAWVWSFISPSTRLPSNETIRGSA